jgi:hypothetical protein
VSRTSQNDRVCAPPPNTVIGSLRTACGDEARHDHAIAPDLARTDGVEEARDHRRDAEALRIGQAQRLVGDLAHRIAPARTGARADRRGPGLRAGSARRCGRRPPSWTPARPAASSLPRAGAQHALATGDVGGEHLGRLGEHAVDADDGRQVVDAVGPADDAVQPVPGQDVGFVETEVGIVLVGGQIGAHAGRQIVDHVDLVAAGKVQVHQVRADEAGPPVIRICMGALPLVSGWWLRSRRCDVSHLGHAIGVPPADSKEFPVRRCRGAVPCHGRYQRGCGAMSAAMSSVRWNTGPMPMTVGIMEVRRQYRHVRRLGDLPEAGLPAFDRLAGAFRRQPNQNCRIAV